MPGDTIPLCVPNLSDKERGYLLECIDSGFVSSVGPFVEKFETEFAQWIGAKYAIACASGTAALHLALQAVGVCAGDNVLVSDFTFIASANPIIYLGATPGFIDSERSGWNMDPGLLESALRELSGRGIRPRAVIVVHIYGAPANIGPILSLCESYGIPVIEDATEALGARFTADYPHAACRNRSAGTVGKMGCFSFNGNKLITTGGGGMVTTDDPDLATWVKHMSCQAKLPGVAFVHDQVGYNYRLINLAAALGCAQLERLDDFIRSKQETAARYREFGRVRGFRSQCTPPGTITSDWMSALIIEKGRDSLADFLSGRGIGCRPGWLPLSSQEPLRKYSSWRSGVSESLNKSVLCLPCSTGLSQIQQQYVLDSIGEWAAN